MLIHRIDIWRFNLFIMNSYLRSKSCMLELVIRLHLWFYLTYHTRFNHLFEGLFSCADHQVWSKSGARLHLVFFTTYFGSSVSFFFKHPPPRSCSSLGLSSFSFLPKNYNFFHSSYFHYISKLYAKVHNFIYMFKLDLRSALFHDQKLRSIFPFYHLKW